MTDVPKVVRDGKVAVLVSPGFGAGWYSWNEEQGPECLFNPGIVALLEQGVPAELVQASAESRWPEGYWGGARDLKVEWVPVGKAFRVIEYDGSEYLEFSEGVEWIVA